MQRRIILGLIATCALALVYSRSAAVADETRAPSGSLEKAAAVPVKPSDHAWLRDASPEMGRMGHRANHGSRRNAGSAGMLTGSTLLYEIFVSDRKSSWTDDRKQEIRKRVDDALDFLVMQGLKYQQRVHFAQVFAEPVALDEEISTQSQADPGWTARAVEKANHTDANTLVEQFRKSHRVENVLILLHLNKSGRSYNISYYRGVPKEFAAERLILFTQFDRRRQTPPATYAHEILHGFGAGDLYFPFDQDDGRYLRAKKLFPNDVMFRIDNHIGRLEVDAWTAYRVGWLKELKPELAFLEDGG